MPLTIIFVKQCSHYKLFSYITLVTRNHSHSAGLRITGIEEAILDGLAYCGFRYFPNVQLVDSSNNQKVVWNRRSLRKVLDTEGKYNLLVYL